MIKVLIVDEELLAGVRIERLLAATKNIEVIGVAVNGSDAQAISDKQNPDILLLKCPISPSNEPYVLELVRRADFYPVLMFCPSFDGFNPMPAAIKRTASFKMKLVNSDDLLTVVLSASKLIHKRRKEKSVEPRTHLYVYSYLGIDKIPVDKILLLQADQKYVRVYISDSVVTVNDSLKSLEKEFKQLFVRVHRNALVAISAIQGLDRSDDQVSVKITGLSTEPRVSRRRASYLRQLLPLL